MCLCSLLFFVNFSPNRKPEKECPLCFLAHGNQRPGSPPPSAVIELGKRSRLHKAPLRGGPGCTGLAQTHLPAATRLQKSQLSSWSGIFPGFRLRKNFRVLEGEGRSAGDLQPRKGREGESDGCRNWQVDRGRQGLAVTGKRRARLTLSTLGGGLLLLFLTPPTRLGTKKAANSAE